MIRLENISVTFGRGSRLFKAVDDVSLQIAAGEVFGIVGASGAGKSTLLRTINLLEPPTSGSVMIDGHIITGFRGEALRRIRLKIGMIFQHFNLLHNRTVAQNIALALQIARFPNKEISPRVNELLALVGLTDKRDAYPAQLSGGQKQRVGIARALANRPQILLCDEPTSALDLETTKSILELLKNINLKLGITVVLITHEMDVVKSICDRVAVMNQGKVVELNDVYHIFSDPTHEATRDLVRHTMNFELPEVVFRKCEGTLLKIIYRGEKAVEPVLSDTAQLFDVNLNILHGKIEYIGGHPIGVFVVNIGGNRFEAIKAVNYIREKTADTEVLHGN